MVIAGNKSINVCKRIEDPRLRVRIHNTPNINPAIICSVITLVIAQVKFP
jgi:TnpA family transposase